MCNCYFYLESHSSVLFWGQTKNQTNQSLWFSLTNFESYLVISRWAVTTITTATRRRPFRRRRFVSFWLVPKHRPSLRRPSIRLMSAAVYRKLFWLVDSKMNVLVWGQTLLKLIVSGESSFWRVRTCIHLNHSRCLGANWTRFAAFTAIHSISSRTTWPSLWFVLSKYLFILQRI